MITSDQVPDVSPTSARASGISFDAWLKAQRHRQDPVGDMARETKRDRGWPRNASYKRQRRRLLRLDAPMEAFFALRRAWDEYEGRVDRRGRPTQEESIRRILAMGLELPPGLRGSQLAEQVGHSQRPVGGPPSKKRHAQQLANVV